MNREEKVLLKISFKSINGNIIQKYQWNNKIYEKYKLFKITLTFFF